MPNEPDHPLRGTGRTTILMLRAIADAMENPHEVVVFEDHDRCSIMQLENLRGCLRGICGALSLQIEVTGRRAIGLRSTMPGVRAAREEYSKKVAAEQQRQQQAAWKRDALIRGLIGDRKRIMPQGAWVLIASMIAGALCGILFVNLSK